MLVYDWICDKGVGLVDMNNYLVTICRCSHWHSVWYNVTSKLRIIYFFFLCSRVYGSVNIGIILPHEELLSHLMKYEVLRSVCYTSPSWSRQSHFVIYSRMCATDLPFFANVIWVPWYDMDTNADSIMTL